jgi:hypothetical protein
MESARSRVFGSYIYAFYVTGGLALLGIIVALTDTRSLRMGGQVYGLFLAVQCCGALPVSRRTDTRPKAEVAPNREPINGAQKAERPDHPIRRDLSR